MSAFNQMFRRHVAKSVAAVPCCDRYGNSRSSVSQHSEEIPTSLDVEQEWSKVDRDGSVSNCTPAQGETAFGFGWEPEYPVINIGSEISWEVKVHTQSHHVHRCDTRFYVNQESGAFGITADACAPNVTPRMLVALIRGIVGGVKKRWRRPPPPPSGRARASGKPCLVPERERERGRERRGGHWFGPGGVPAALPGLSLGRRPHRHRRRRPVGYQERERERREPIGSSPGR